MQIRGNRCTFATVDEMSTLIRQVYVISDLHLGGAPGKTGDPKDRGFRMMQQPDRLADFIDELVAKPKSPSAIELVINGDFVDFLAEPDSEVGAPTWKAFRADPGLATTIFQRMWRGRAMTGFSRHWPTCSSTVTGSC